MEQSGDNRSTQFLIQKVASDVQCGNAASVMARVCFSAHGLSKAKTFFLFI